MERAGDHCEKCGLSPPTEWHHVLTRGYPSIRHDPMNGVGLCLPCHEKAHAHGSAFRRWWAARIGHKEWLRLRSAFTTKEWGGKNADANRRAWKSDPSSVRTCLVCGVEFQNRARGVPTKWCSNKCRYEGLKSDPVCGKAATLSGCIRLGPGKRVAVEKMLSEALDKPCTYCGRIVTLTNASIDHKTPRRGMARSGNAASRYLDRRENLHIICRKCNLAKGALSHEGFLRLLKFLRGDPELYAAVMPRLGLAGQAWKRIKGLRRGRA